MCKNFIEQGLIRCCATLVLADVRINHQNPEQVMWWQEQITEHVSTCCMKRANTFFVLKNSKRWCCAHSYTSGSADMHVLSKGCRGSKNNVSMWQKWSFDRLKLGQHDGGFCPCANFCLMCLIEIRITKNAGVLKTKTPATIWMDWCFNEGLLLLSWKVYLPVHLPCH